MLPTTSTCSFPTAGEPIIITYLTNPGESVDKLPWLLGLTAAIHNISLVLAGEGIAWNHNQRTSSKLTAILELIEHLSRVSPKSPLIFADGADTLVSNPVTPKVLRRLQDLVERDQVIFASECSSWPLCYKEKYRNNEDHAACSLKSGIKTCFLNSGIYAGSSRALLRLLPQANGMAQNLTGSEHADDQAALHHLMFYSELNSMRVDYESQLFLTLRRCSRLLSVFPVDHMQYTMCAPGQLQLSLCRKLLAVGLSASRGSESHSAGARTPINTIQSGR